MIPAAEERFRWREVEAKVSRALVMQAPRYAKARPPQRFPVTPSSSENPEIPDGKVPPQERQRLAQMIRLRRRQDSPEQINEDPYGSGWICKIKVGPDLDLSGLLDAGSYSKLIGE